METIACDIGLNLFTLLGLTGTVYTDCQGLTATLHHSKPLKHSGGKPCLPFLRACARALRQPNISLRWIRSHPERQPDLAIQDWSRDQWGIYLADLCANPLPWPNPLYDFPRPTPLALTMDQLHTISQTDLDWNWTSSP